MYKKVLRIIVHELEKEVLYHLFTHKGKREK